MKRQVEAIGEPTPASFTNYADFLPAVSFENLSTITQVKGVYTPVLPRSSSEYVNYVSGKSKRSYGRGRSGRSRRSRSCSCSSREGGLTITPCSHTAGLPSLILSFPKLFIR